MKLQVLCWILFGLLLISIVGCGGIQENENLTSLFVLTPIPTNFVQGDCEDPAILENWIQTLVFNQAEFDNFLNNATGKSRTELYRMTQDLNDAALTVATIPILSCGEEAYNLTIVAMEQTLSAMENYINAERQDLEVILLSSKRNFETATQAQLLIIEQLEALYQPENTATP